MEVSAHKPYKPEWGSLDILEACGASDLGSNPSSGASNILVQNSCPAVSRHQADVHLGIVLISSSIFVSSAAETSFLLGLLRIRLTSTEALLINCPRGGESP